MKTMTIRNIPDDVAANLAALAKSSNRSVNATVVGVLARSFAPSSKPVPKVDFSEFCGLWSKEKADAVAKEIEECFEQIDPAAWK